MTRETAAARWERYHSLLADEPLPAALVDLDALDENVEWLLAPVRARGKKLRLASKSIRCPTLLRYLVERGRGAVCGLMTYAASETAFLADQGFSDLLLAYPTVRTCDLALLAQVNDRGTTAAVVVDCIAHLAALEKEAAGAKIPVVIEVDLSYRPIERVHLGVRRSPLRSVEEVVALAERIGGFPHLAFHGLMGY